MKKPPFTKNEVEKIISYLTEATKRALFESPDMPNKKLLILSLLPAPFNEKGFNTFKKNKHYLETKEYIYNTYTLNEYRIVAVSIEHVKQFKVVLHLNEYLVDIQEFEERGNHLFDFPESILEN